MPIVLSGALQETTNLKDYVDTYLYDNGDGTTTISEEFITLVLQSYKQYKEDNGLSFDGSMDANEDGYYYFPDFTATAYHPSSSTWCGSVVFTDIYSYYPCAVLLRSNFWRGTGYETAGYIIYYNASSDEFFCMQYVYDENGVLDPDIIHPANSSFLNPQKAHKAVKDGYAGPAYFDTLSLGWAVNVSYPGACMTASSSCIPTYNDLSALKHGLRTGDFSAAHNYGTEASWYDGTYSGGDITVETEKLQGILDKLDELDETGKGIDDKLGDLLDWLGIGDSSGGTAAGGITGWLQKIYNRLGDMLSQLKSIKRWTVVDTVIDGVDAVADWLDLIHDVLSDADDGAEAAVATLSSALDGASGLLKQKFPFSIPWDILFLVTILAADPEPPHFEVPFQIDLSLIGYTVDYTFEIDFTRFQWLSDILRALLSMTYAVGLMKMTASVADIKREE
ncbi:MAG: hypothetical protein J6A08_00200 [Lachnospiraceae bacterium]|nr:hypothetical protein [Lachnospiraceae bacterium]